MAKQEIQEQEIKVEETTKEEKENIEYEDEEILTPENKAILKKLIKTE
jgi:ethanolamine utilization cobalamin adenosyltransferase